MRKGKGQALIEFTLVIGVVIILATGAVQALYTFTLIRRVRASAEAIADAAAVRGGDTADVRELIPDILSQHRLDDDLATVEIVPQAAAYLEEMTITLHYDASVRFYGLFTLRLPPQQVLRLSEGG
jgi:hypothetical protein